MLFNVALFGSLLLAPVVLAVSSGLDAAIARRQTATTSLNAAGAMYIKDNGTFSAITGTFTVPTPSGTLGESAAIWVGIDDGTCTSAAFQAGIVTIVGSNGPQVGAWCQFHPRGALNLTVIDIFPGDVVKLSIVTSSATSGTATIHNLSNGESVSATLNSAAPLCGRDVEWIVQGVTIAFTSVPLANFGTVSFTHAEATGPKGQHYGPGNATIMEFLQNNTVMTNVSTGDTSVTIQYV